MAAKKMINDIFSRKLSTDDVSSKVRIAINKPKELHNRDKLKNMPKKPADYHLFYKPKSEQEIKDLVRDFLEWTDLEDSVNINDFPISKGMSPYRFKRINDEYFREAYELGCYKIMSRTTRLLNSHEMNEKLFFTDRYQYDLDYRESEDEKLTKRISGIKKALGDITLVDHMMEK